MRRSLTWIAVATAFIALLVAVSAFLAPRGTIASYYHGTSDYKLERSAGHLLVTRITYGQPEEISSSQLPQTESANVIKVPTWVFAVGAVACFVVLAYYAIRARRTPTVAHAAEPSASRAALDYMQSTGGVFTRRRLIIVLLAIGALALIWPAYRVWSAYTFLVSVRDNLEPVAIVEPIYSEDAGLIKQFGGRPEYISISLGAQRQALQRTAVRDDVRMPGLVLLGVWRVAVKSGQERLLGVWAHVESDGDGRKVSLFSRLIAPPTWGDAWSGRVRAREVGRLNAWLRLQQADSLTLYPARPVGNSGNDFVIRYQVNGVDSECPGSRRDAVVVFGPANSPAFPTISEELRE